MMSCLESILPTAGCASNPCQNGGACLDVTPIHVCFCPAGYGGENCENACE